MKTRTITIEIIRGLAEQLEADAARTREILAQATAGEISPAEGAKKLSELGIAIL